jgi:glycolate oxidase FAD binding subunit
MTWGAAPLRGDLIIETTGLDRVLEHAAGDLVARVQAGAGVGQLATVLRAAGQQLALDPLGTVGGMLATGAAGPRRLRYGTPRDLLIGITVILADGTVAKAGGKVVKNVAGYDLGKLFAGSYGTLGLITEAVFRLHPLPAASAFVTIDCAEAAAAAAAICAAAASALAPSAAEIDWPGGGAPIRAGVLLEGTEAGAAERAERMRELLGGGALISKSAPSWWGAPAATADGTVIRIAFWAGRLAGVLAVIAAAAAAAGLDPAVSGSAAAGVLYAAVPESAAPAAVAEFLARLRAALGHRQVRADEGTASAPAAAHAAHVPDAAAAPRAPQVPHTPHASHAPQAARAARAARAPYAPQAPQAPDAPDAPDPPAAAAPDRPDAAELTGASAVVVHAPAGVRAAVDMWGPVPSLGLMRAIKDQFDPEHRMAPGRFAGGI